MYEIDQETRLSEEFSDKKRSSCARFFEHCFCDTCLPREDTAREKLQQIVF